MNKTTEALKLAEEAFQSMLDNDGGEGSKCYSALRWYEARQDSYKALAVIREALEDHSGDANEMVADQFRDATKMVAKPVQQEPIGYVVECDYGYKGSMIYSNKTGDDLVPVYLAPVDAKAIIEMRDKAFKSYVDQVKADRELSVLQARLEALEEAAKVCDDESRYSNDAECCAAAIRGLK